MNSGVVTNLQDRLSQKVQCSQLAHRSVGVAMAARIGSASFTSTTGHSSLTFLCPMQDRTLLNIGSVTKHMVALVILELARSKKLSLGDPITDHLGMVRRADWNGASLLDLLRHTSGIPDCHHHFAWDQATSVNSIAVALAGRPSHFIPGRAWAYSNSNYLLLGMVIEAVTGARLRDVLQEQVFESANLPHARCDSTRSVIRDRAEPYEHVRGNFVHAARLHPNVTSLGGFGALFSGEDFLVWAEALSTGSLANDHNTCLVPVELHDGTLLPYGLGWYLGMMRGRMFAWHMGAPPGFRTIHLHLPGEAVALSLSSNTNVDKTMLRETALELLELMLPGSTFLSIEPEERVSERERCAIQALVQAKGQSPPPDILTEAMQYTWVCNPGSTPMNNIALEDCWVLESHRFGDGTMKNYAADAAGVRRHFSVLWTEDGKAAALTT